MRKQERKLGETMVAANPSDFTYYKLIVASRHFMTSKVAHTLTFFLTFVPSK